MLPSQQRSIQTLCISNKTSHEPEFKHVNVGSVICMNSEDIETERRPDVEGLYGCSGSQSRASSSRSAAHCRPRSHTGMTCCVTTRFCGAQSNSASERPILSRLRFCIFHVKFNFIWNKNLFFNNLLGRRVTSRPTDGGFDFCLHLKDGFL